MAAPEFDKETVFKGIRKVSMAIPLMFLGPVIINSSFKNQNHPFYYVVLIVGILICLFSMFLFFKGITTMVKGFFNDNLKK
ncbi:DUF6095 family protein [Flavobacterium sp. I3-2]|uniref:DUF6095 family protein n=1 Tax=Flavobacterium sp. I3-2 TaxID=2748319 RepID=UPI0015ABBD67|nr:DUF6095 family protein [Flavobacterium sp. I3-2]